MTNGRKKTNDDELFAFCMKRVVKGVIFNEAGKRMGMSIFRADDLSFLCSNL